MSNKIPFSQCKRIIRESRDLAGYKFPCDWAAYLWQSDWLSCADFEVGSADFMGWAGLWVLDHADLSSPHRLFRDLRDPAITCCVMVESGNGSMRVWVETRAVELVEADLESQYSESCFCASCGGSVHPDETLEYRGDTICYECGIECESCGRVELDMGASGAVVVIDHDTGSQGYLCGSCLESGSE